MIYSHFVYITLSCRTRSIKVESICLACRTNQNTISKNAEACNFFFYAYQNPIYAYLGRNCALRSRYRTCFYFAKGFYIHFSCASVRAGRAYVKVVFAYLDRTPNAIPRRSYAIIPKTTKRIPLIVAIFFE